MVEIAGKNTMPEFTENLRGASPGDERVFEVVYADDAQEQRLAGKTFTYTVKVQAIKQKTLPELNDEFATQLGEFKTLDEVRQRIRESMEAERKHNAEHEAKDKLVAELVKRSDFEVPEALVDRPDRCPPGTRTACPSGAGNESRRHQENGFEPACEWGSGSRRYRK